MVNSFHLLIQTIRVHGEMNRYFICTIEQRAYRTVSPPYFRCLSVTATFSIMFHFRLEMNKRTIQIWNSIKFHDINYFRDPHFYCIRSTIKLLHNNKFYFVWLVVCFRAAFTYVYYVHSSAHTNSDK